MKYGRLETWCVCLSVGLAVGCLAVLISYLDMGIGADRRND